MLQEARIFNSGRKFALVIERFSFYSSFDSNDSDLISLLEYVSKKLRKKNYQISHGCIQGCMGLVGYKVL